MVVLSVFFLVGYALDGHAQISFSWAKDERASRYHKYEMTTAPIMTDFCPVSLLPRTLGGVKMEGALM